MNLFVFRNKQWHLIDQCCDYWVACDSYLSLQSPVHSPFPHGFNTLTSFTGSPWDVTCQIHIYNESPWTLTVSLLLFCRRSGKYRTTLTAVPIPSLRRKQPPICLCLTAPGCLDFHWVTQHGGNNWPGCAGMIYPKTFRIDQWREGSSPIPRCY